MQYQNSPYIINDTSHDLKDSNTYYLYGIIICLILLSIYLYKEGETNKLILKELSIKTKTNNYNDIITNVDDLLNQYLKLKLEASIEMINMKEEALSEINKIKQDCIKELAKCR